MIIQMNDEQIKAFIKTKYPILNDETFISLKFNVISGSTTNANLNHSAEVISDSIGDPANVNFVDGVICYGTIDPMLHSLVSIIR